MTLTQSPPPAESRVPGRCASRQALRAAVRPEDRKELERPSAGCSGSGRRRHRGTQAASADVSKSYLTSPSPGTTAGGWHLGPTTLV